MRKYFVPLCMILAMCVSLATASADVAPKGSVAANMKLVGFSNLGGRYGGFKMALNKAANGRWYLYQGHTFDLGWSILDVTTPENPRYVKFIPYPDAPKEWATSQVTVHGNLMVTAIDHRLDRKDGLAALFWDISDPENPKQIGTWTAGNGGTHRNSYPGGKYAYMSATYPGYSGRIIVILDVSDPAHPKEVGKWAQPGQARGETPMDFAANYGPAVSFHGPANVSPDGKMITTGFSPDLINLDITDPANPKLIGRLRLLPFFANVGAQSVHSVLPFWERKMLFVSSEAMLENCRDNGFQGGLLVDNSNPADPFVMSVLPTPQPPPSAPYQSFCDKGGRFGPHNTNQEIHNDAVQKPGNLLYVTWFNAGLRVFDVSDGFNPKEVAYFIPPERPGLPQQAGAHASEFNWTEEVAVDARGYVYINDDKWGTFILKYTGKAPTESKPLKRGVAHAAGAD